MLIMSEPDSGVVPHSQVMHSIAAISTLIAYVCWMKATVDIALEVLYIILWMVDTCEHRTQRDATLINRVL